MRSKSMIPEVIFWSVIISSMFIMVFAGGTPIAPAPTEPIEVPCPCECPK